MELLWMKKHNIDYCINLTEWWQMEAFTGCPEWHEVTHK